MDGQALLDRCAVLREQARVHHVRSLTLRLDAARLQVQAQDAVLHVQVARALVEASRTRGRTP